MCEEQSFSTAPDAQRRRATQARAAYELLVVNDQRFLSTCSMSITLHLLLLIAQIPYPKPMCGRSHKPRKHQAYLMRYRSASESLEQILKHQICHHSTGSPRNMPLNRDGHHMASEPCDLHRRRVYLNDSRSKTRCGHLAAII